MLALNFVDLSMKSGEFDKKSGLAQFLYQKVIIPNFHVMACKETYLYVGITDSFYKKTYLYAGITDNSTYPLSLDASQRIVHSQK
jgi:hypothetical protein